MKGLLLKDLLVMRSYLLLCFCILIALVTGMNLSGAADAQGFTVGCCALVGGMMCPASFGYDSKSDWGSYVLTFPYTKRQIVFSKYLFGLLLIGVCAMIGVLINTVFAWTGIISFGTDSLSIALSIIGMTVIAIGIAMPFFYKYGVEKGQLVVITICVPVFMILAKGFLMLQIAEMRQMLDLIPVFVLITATAVTILSYRITCHIYEETDSRIKKVRKMRPPKLISM